MVHLALHAAHHGPRVEPPLRDLRRALESCSDERWAEAAVMAERIGASTAFANGLGLLPAGRERSALLGLTADYTAAWRLGVQGEPVAAGIERLARAPGLRARASLLRDELFPTREFLRWWIPKVRGAWPGLARAYAWRWLYLARRAPAALRAWRRAQRHL
jgi:hypothetical protein